MSTLKNDIFLQALAGKTLRRPPVWMMRQAGRYLPDFMKLKEKYDFFTRCQTPELASEITVMPIDQIGTDAASEDLDVKQLLVSVPLRIAHNTPWWFPP